MADVRGRGSRRTFASSQRRRTSWEAGVGGTGVTTISASGVNFIGSTVTPTTLGSTTIRIRGLLRWYLTTANAIGAGFQGAFGIGIATAAAIAAGIASVPTPLAEQGNENWLFWHVLSLHTTTSGLVAEQPMAQTIEIDTKAMRKLPDGMGLYAALELVEIGTATAELFLDTRELILLA